jgi:hypothetical protein
VILKQDLTRIVTGDTKDLFLRTSGRHKGYFGGIGVLNVDVAPQDVAAADVVVSLDSHLLHLPGNKEEEMSEPYRGRRNFKFEGAFFYLKNLVRENCNG